MPWQNFKVDIKPTDQLAGTDNTWCYSSQLSAVGFPSLHKLGAVFSCYPNILHGQCVALLVDNSTTHRSHHYKLSSQLIFDQSCKANQGFCGSSYLSVCVRLCPPYQLHTLLLLHTRATEQNLSRHYTIYRAPHYQTIRFIYRTSRFCFKFGVALTPLYHCLTGSAQRVQIF